MCPHVFRYLIIYIYIHTCEKYIHILYSVHAVLSLLTDKHVYVLVHVSVSLYSVNHKYSSLAQHTHRRSTRLGQYENMPESVQSINSKCVSYQYSQIYASQTCVIQRKKKKKNYKIL